MTETSGELARTFRRSIVASRLKSISMRLATIAVSLLILSIAVFSLVQLVPGDLAATILGPYATSEQLAALNKSLGTDQPPLYRYLTWLSGFLRGDWGQSMLLGVPVFPLVMGHLTNSLLMAFSAILAVVPVSIAAGMLAAVHQGKLIDRIISVSGLVLLGIPEFVSGVILLVLFGVYLKWFPVQSQVPTSIFDFFYYLTLPVLPLVLLLFGYFSRMMRSSTIEVLESNYVRSAVLKGLSTREVLFNHVFRNAALPTISVVTGQAGYLIGGLVIIETLFSYPGIGNLAYQAAQGHDVEVLTASVVVIATVVMMVTFVGDVLMIWLNPRARQEDRS
ncbi:ABC transporter permease [Mesorhizobium sp. DCY119]|uniref:ABC transporter permease n=1 Tax=Mesorhizobium sp. DCY119 TaxID=2108445 RepID=UPI000E75FB25|nr:ABC transporter permease [Mesorhizobium sp. DCY119]RJG40469.1 ABC transporter permease [Mesorhizobium sp. DCY119]